MTPSRIYLSSPDVTRAEEEAVVQAFRSGWIAPLGPDVDAFEAELARRCGRTHAVALSSGTAALHLALLNLNVRPDDVVFVASMTFVATANAVSYTGAVPWFVDSDEHGLMDPALLRDAMTQAAHQGRRLAAVVPVDLLGKMADYAALTAVADEFGVPVLSDAAESLGAVRDGRPAGSPGDAAIVSFNGNKIMTTSGGGALLTDDPAIAERTRYLATQARQPAVHYEHTDIGYNYRMSNLLAALGRAQLTRLDGMIERRRQHRIAYREVFDGVPGVSLFGSPDGSSPTHPSGTRDNFWLTAVVVDPSQAGWSAADLMASLAEANIESRPLWKPMHVQPVYASNPATVNGTSERLFAQGLSLPSGSALTEDQFARIEEHLSSFVTSPVRV